MLSRRRPSGRRAAAALTVGVLASLLLGAALAQAPAQAATGTYVRIARLAPSGADADVYITSVADPVRWYLVAGMRYGDVSPYRGIEPGVYTVSARQAGAPPDSPPMLSTTLEATSGGSYTVLGLDAPGGPTFRVLGDDLTPPAPQQTRLRVIPAAPSVPRLDAAVEGGPEIGTALAYGDPSGYRPVTPGPATLRTTAGPGRTVSFPVDLPPGGVGTVLVLDRGGALQATTVVDARGPGRAPNGGVETGRGGAAAAAWTGASTVAALVIGAGLVIGIAFLRPRRVR